MNENTCMDDCNIKSQQCVMFLNIQATMCRVRGRFAIACFSVNVSVLRMTNVAC